LQAIPVDYIATPGVRHFAGDPLSEQQMSVLLQDVRYALRSFSRRPGFTAVLVATLALGIGSNVAIFGVANAVLFQPLPYEDPEELALVWTKITNQPRALVSGPDFIDYRNETTLFEGFAGAVAIDGALTGEARAEEITAGYSTANLFHILGVSPMIGRNFEPADEAPIDPAIFSDPNAELPPGHMLLSHALWRRRYGGDPDVVGKTLQIDGANSIIVGVLPPTFRIYLPEDAGMPTDIDAWGVLPSNFSQAARDAAWLTVVTRLKNGVTMEQAQQEMDALAARLREQYQHHADGKMQIAVNSMHRDVVNHARPVLLALLGAVGFVLLIACANVANLLLVRATTREREIAVRAALGSGRGRIIRQMLTESAVLGVAGTAVGVLLAWFGGRVLIAMRPETLARFEQFSIDGTVLLFTAAVTGIAVVLFGLAPALRAARSSLADSLRDRGADAGGVRGNKLRTALVVAEVALSLVLLIGTGLMLRTFAKLRAVDPGFETEGVLTFTVPVPMFKYRDPVVRTDIFTRIQAQIEALPGVRTVGATSLLPLAGGDQYGIGGYGLSGSTEEEWRSNRADYRAILPGYEDAMGVRIVAGRAIEPTDNRTGALDVVVIDEKLARRLWPDGEAVGKELQIERFSLESFGLERVPMQVVGVAENVRAQSLASEGRETVYYPYRFFPWFPLSFTVRASGGLMGLVEPIRREVQAIDPDIPLSKIRVMDSYVDDALAQTQFALTLIGVFAALALVLASVGLYGVIAYSVRQRTREIGVRIAFGASDSAVVRLVVGQGMLLALGGLTVGLIAAFVVTRLVSSLFYGVTAADPITFVLVSLVLGGVAVVASYIPAKRATRIDPVVALRDE
jgi:putative ABC transport system permease protein